MTSLEDNGSEPEDLNQDCGWAQCGRVEDSA